VKNYKVYYRKKIKDTWNLLATLDANNFSYTDTNSLLKYSIAGCYAVTAIDSIGNESSINGNAFCIDNCPYYVLPNVFTPNNDVNNLNEMFKPFPYRFIEKIELQIFNRWGTPVFETTDIDINWNGKDKETGNELSAGTYFYTIKIFENYLGGTTERKVRGTITIMR
jgi:gliding motility-associated-like protein